MPNTNIIFDIVYIARTIEKAAKSINETYPVLLITGLRQVGKTTLLQQIATPDQKYVTLDNPTFREIANNEPELFLQRFSPPSIIDEIQYATGLLEYIKIYVDTHKNCGDFWLTSSQAFHMMKKVSEKLASRVGILYMSGLSNSEINRYSLLAFEIIPEILIRNFLGITRARTDSDTRLIVM